MLIDVLAALAALAAGCDTPDRQPAAGAALIGLDAAVWRAEPGSDPSQIRAKYPPNAGRNPTDPAPAGPAGRASGSIPYNRSFKKPAVARPAWGAGV